MVKRAVDVVLSVGAIALFAGDALGRATDQARFGRPRVLSPIPGAARMAKRSRLVKFRTMVDGAQTRCAGAAARSRASGNDDVLFKLDATLGLPITAHVASPTRSTSRRSYGCIEGRHEHGWTAPAPFDEEALQATEIFAARTRMKPGIAGPWQALGRSTIPFEDMIRLDYAYVVGWSISTDLLLLLRTVATVAKREGAM